MIYLGKNAVGISDTVQVVSEDIVNRVNAVEIKETVSTPSNILTIYDGADNVPVDELVVGIEPVQDLHGHDNPWPAGGGKNLLQVAISSQTVSGLSITVTDDGWIIADGTASEPVQLIIAYVNVSAGTQYILNGCPAGGGTSTYRLMSMASSGVMADTKTDSGNGVTCTAAKNGTAQFRLMISSGVEYNNLTFKPMFRLATITDDTYAPYSNVCPISGWTGAKVTHTGKNILGGDLLRDSILASIAGATDDPVIRAVRFKANATRIMSITDACGLTDHFKPNTNYTFISTISKEGGIGSNLRFRYSDDTTAVTKSVTSAGQKETGITVSNSAKTLSQIEYNNSSGYTTLYYDESGIFEGDLTADDFEPYSGEIYDIAFPTEAGTVYGGTLTIHKDGTGTLVIDKATVNMKNSPNTSFASPDDRPNFIRYNGCAGRIYGNTPNSAFISADYKWTLSSSTTGLYNTLQNGECGGQTTVVWIVFRDDRIADDTLYPTKDDKITAFKELLVDGTICYPVNTNRSYDLTAPQVKTLLGTNNIWADTGAIQSLTYSADPKMYVDQHSVSDVQVNGISVVTDGVANVPVASDNDLGAVKVVPSNGVEMASDGSFFVKDASDAQIKEGTAQYRPISPRKQDRSVFYGLAKAAGNSTQSASSNAVGNYTPEAKSAISTMLSAPVTVSGTTPSITAMAGVRYICGECATLDITVPASGIIDVVFESGSTATVLTVMPPTGITAVKWANGFDPTSLDANTVYEINIMDGCYGVVGSWT